MQLIENVEAFVKKQLEAEGTGHDWMHIDRVRRTAVTLAKKYSCNDVVVELAALLHDVIDDKLSPEIRLKTDDVEQFLNNEGLDRDSIQEVLSVISTISYKGGTGEPVSSIEAQLVQDADRLDAMGAIGIARVFSFGGSKGNLIYDPDIPARESMTYDEYRNMKSTSINHFYEKLLKLKDLMNTEEGKIVAQQRHQFMLDYLSQFFLEWEGPRRSNQA